MYVERYKILQDGIITVLFLYILKYDGLIWNHKKNIAISWRLRFDTWWTKRALIDLHLTFQAMALLIGRGSGNVTVSTDYGRSSGLVWLWSPGNTGREWVSGCVNLVLHHTTLQSHHTAQQSDLTEAKRMDFYCIDPVHLLTHRHTNFFGELGGTNKFIT
jgi:hypothetical protein